MTAVLSAVPAQPNAAPASVAADAFELFPSAIMVCDRSGRVVAANARLRELAGADHPVGASCCTVLGCGQGCLTARVLERGHRIETPGVVAAPLYEDRSHVVFELRDEPSREAGARLRIFALGPLRVETDDGPLKGPWLEQRPGLLLRFLAASRGRIVSADEIAHGIWPGGGPSAANTVRHFVHALRKELEPTRPKNGASRFIVCRRGGYGLDLEHVWIDADEFEHEADSGAAAAAAGNALAAEACLERAARLYRDDLLVDEPYADWAITERERLRSTACNVLRQLADVRADRAEAAAPCLERLAEMEPYDCDVQQRLISTWLRLGRRSRAARHYQSFKLRLMREFGERPAFELSGAASAVRIRPRAGELPQLCGEGRRRT